MNKEERKEKYYEKNYATHLAKYYIRKAQDPEGVREENRLKAEAYRRDHGDKWKAYFKNYFANYLKDPINKRSHNCRNYLNGYYRRYCAGKNVNEKWIDICEFIKSNNYDSKKHSKDHIISLKYLYKFNIDIPYEVACDVKNMRIVSRKKNNEKKDKITVEALIVAKYFEETITEYCTGLYDYLLVIKDEQDKCYINELEVIEDAKK